VVNQANLNAWTEAFEFLQFLNSPGTPGTVFFASSPTPVPFYADLSSHGAVQFNFGYGFDITINGIQPLLNLAQLSLSAQSYQSLVNAIVSLQTLMNTTNLTVNAANTDLAAVYVAIV
jgi:hypothetical protein